MAKPRTVIALTGGIGSGKSVVSDLFAKQGASIIDTDVIARDLTQKDKPAFQKIVARYGQEITKNDGTLDRKQLRQKIFDDKQERMWLEDLLHPLIREQVKKQLPTINAPYVIVVIPLLTDKKKLDYINRVLVVDAPEALQISRACARDNMSPSLAKTILATQISRQARLALADDIIVNDKTLDDLAAQVDALHQKYGG